MGRGSAVCRRFVGHVISLLFCVKVGRCADVSSGTSFPFFFVLKLAVFFAGAEVLAELLGRHLDPFDHRRGRMLIQAVK